MAWYNATALYGKGFKPTESPDVFEIRVYTGGFAGLKTAAGRAAKEAAAFAQEHGFSGHEIVASRRIWVPSCVDVRVRFRR